MWGTPLPLPLASSFSEPFSLTALRVVGRGGGCVFVVGVPVAVCKWLIVAVCCVPVHCECEKGEAGGEKAGDESGVGLHTGCRPGLGSASSASSLK